MCVYEGGCSTWPYRDLHFFDAGVNVKDCVVTWTDDGFVFNDDNLWREEEHT